MSVVPICLYGAEKIGSWVDVIWLYGGCFEELIEELSREVKT